MAHGGVFNKHLLHSSPIAAAASIQAQQRDPAQHVMLNLIAEDTREMENKRWMAFRSEQVKREESE